MIQLDTALHVCGIGTVGSNFMRQYTKRRAVRFRNVHVYDHDTVALENCEHAAFEREHVGMPKVAAIGKQTMRWGDIEPTAHIDFIDDARAFDGVVVFAVDTMKSRWQIWETSVRKREAVQLLIDVRIETTNALIHVLDPNRDEHVREWEGYWYPDADPNGRSCGAAMTHGPMGDLAANIALWQLEDWARKTPEERQQPFVNQIRINDMFPITVESYVW